LFQFLVLDKRAEIHGQWFRLPTMVLELIYKGPLGILKYTLQPRQKQVTPQKSNLQKAHFLPITKMISIALLVSAVLTLATNQVAAAPSPQVVGTPEAVAIFFSDCATNFQVGIPTQDQVLQPTDSTCYTFAFNKVNQALLAPGFTGNDPSF
jgi:hypothetical protein